MEDRTKGSGEGWGRGGGWEQQWWNHFETVNKSRELKCAVYIVLQECQDGMGKPMDVSMAKPMELKVSMICMVNAMDISMAKAMELKKIFLNVGGRQHQTTWQITDSTFLEFFHNTSWIQLNKHAGKWGSALKLKITAEFGVKNSSKTENQLIFTYKWKTWWGIQSVQIESIAVV